MEIKEREYFDYDHKLLYTVYHKENDICYWHREDGPARIYKNGHEEWHLNDIEYYRPEDMPLNLFLAYVKWEYKKKNGN